MHLCVVGLTFLLVVTMLRETTCKVDKKDKKAGRLAVILAAAANDELDKLGLGHLEVIGTRFIDEHHEIHDYPGDKEDDDDHDDHDDSEDSDYHHVIYDHVDISKGDYSDFGGDDKSSYGYDSSDSEDFHYIDHSH